LKRQKLNNCLIVCDGNISKRLLNTFLKQNERSSFALISADGASNVLFLNNITPDYIIGDLDSIFPDVLIHYKEYGVIIKRIIEQESNDLEKCLIFALSKGMNNIIITGYGGKRIDHTINNFSILKKYSKKGKIKYVDDTFEVFIIIDSVEFDYEIGEVVSIQGFPKAEGIKTEGLKYSLKNESLEFGIREGALNRAISNKIKITVKRGELLVFKRHFGKLNILAN
jgi:thiamine pyrophosphokinase